MTKKLYYDNSYLLQWSTVVTGITGKNGRILATLEESAFYPEGGGQSSDRGTIGGVEVIDVYEENNEVYHVLNSKLQSKQVSCEIDFNRRFDLMQQHSGQHLLSAVFYNLYKGETSSFHLGEDYVSIDISIDKMSSEVIEEVEKTANEYIYKNLVIKAYFVNEANLSNIPLRKYPSVKENIRIVEIDGFDYSPCGGTHVSRTGEIGLIKIIKTENNKGVTRVYFKCGKRAIQDYVSKHNIVSNLSSYLSVKDNEILSRVKNDNELLKSLDKEIKSYKEELAKVEAKNVVDSTNENIINLCFENRTFDDLKILANAIASQTEKLSILSSLSERKVICTSNGNIGSDIGKFFKENLQNFNGKGGGSPKQAQASFENVKDIQEFIKAITSSI